MGGCYGRRHDKSMWRGPPFEALDPSMGSLFPTLAVGFLDLKIDVVLARLEADFSDQPPSIPAVPKRRVSLECPTAGYQYSCSTFGVLQGRQLRGAGKRYTSCAIAALGWGCSQ